MSGVGYDPGEGLLYVGRFSSDGLEPDGWVSVHDPTGAEVDEIAKGLSGTGTLVAPGRILIRGG